MTNLLIINAEQVEPERLRSALLLAFADYLAGPFRLEPAQWPAFLARQDVDLALSRVAVSDEHIHAFALVARRDARSWRLATMGALPESRGTGAAPLLLDEWIKRAAQQGVTGLELEVFEQNHRAVRLYRSRGFEVQHELHGYTLQALEIAAASPPPVQQIERAEAMAWLDASAARLPYLPLQVTAACLGGLPEPLPAWQHGQAQLVFSVNAARQIQIHSLIDRDPAQHDARILLQTLLSRHPQHAVNVPALQRLDIGGQALRDCGFAAQPLHQLLMIRSL